MNRWAKNGVLDRFLKFGSCNRSCVSRSKHFLLDSTSVKVHPMAQALLKKRPQAIGKISRWMDTKDSYGCRGCSNGHNLFPVSGPRSRRAARTGLTGRVRTYAGGPSDADGSRLRRPMKPGSWVLDLGMIPVVPPSPTAAPVGL